MLILNFLDKLIVKLYLGGEDMVSLYVALIVAGRRTIDQVPPKFKDAVQADLDALGVDGQGNPVGNY